MKLLIKSIFLAAWLALSVSDDAAAVYVLDISPSAAPLGAGGAWVALADDSSSVFYNPAGLGRIYHNEVPYAFNYLHREINGLSQTLIHQHFGLTYSLRDMRTENILDPGTLSASYQTVRDSRDLAEEDMMISSRVLSFAYGKTVMESHAGILTLGAGVKFFNEEYADFDSRGEAFDAGVQWRLPGGVALGAAVRNFGNPVSYPEGSRELPTLVTGGVAGNYMDGAFSTRLDFVQQRGGAPRLNFGTEVWIMNTLALRTGYNPDLSPDTGLTAGAGLRFSQLDILFFYIRELNIDYAYAANVGGDMQRLSLTVKLGAD